MAEPQLLDRALYKKVKSMDRAAMEEVFRNMYQTGYETALNEAAVDFDTEKLRSELSKIKGIGESRLNEIMAVIEEHIKY